MLKPSSAPVATEVFKWLGISGNCRDRRFEDLPVWQKAADLYEATEDLLAQDDSKATRGFRDQLDRAALSVSNDLAQGFERGTTNELL